MFKQPIMFIRDIYNSRELLITMTKRDIKNRYLGSLLGGVWAFVQPLVTIFVMWFVFQVGFRAQSVPDGTPFALWLISGIVPWFFVAEAISNATNSIMEQASIVKKLVFRVSLLPIVKIASALFIHSFFVLVLFLISLLYGYSPSPYWLQIFYYLTYSVILVFGISLITSSIIVFFKDVGQFVAVVIQIGFWVTPILWNLLMLPEKYQWLFKLNPVYYVTEGYRNSLTGKILFVEGLGWVVYYWVMAAFILLLGVYCFKKLRPHFADVL